MDGNWLTALFKELPANITTALKAAVKVAPLQAFGLLLLFVLVLVFLGIFLQALLSDQSGAQIVTFAVASAVLIVLFALVVRDIIGKLPQIQSATVVQELEKLSIEETEVSAQDTQPAGQTGSPPAEGQRPDSLIRAYLRGMASNAALRLGIDQEYIRSNVFLPTNGFIKIGEGYHHNMKLENELTITMPIGFGASGRAFQNGDPVVAIYQEGWGKHALDDEEAKKIHPDLRWIVCLPIRHIRERKVIGVASVDGLTIPFKREKLDGLVEDMFYWGALISRAMST